MLTTQLLNTQVKLEHVEEPFTLHLAQGMLSDEQVRTLYATAPLSQAQPIARTDPDHEKQYKMNLLYLLYDGQPSEAAAGLAPAWSALLDDLRSEGFMTWLEAGTNQKLRDLSFDIGVYTHVDGDFISVHKDKPNKALTAILYLNEDWPAGAGGEYEVRPSGDPRAEPLRRIPPRGGQFLAFPPTDRSWHAVSRVDTGGRVTRLTVQLEFWFHRDDRRH
ncbi:MAG TPA: 2OG-Fe(II) oxygenase [Micromonosporaceae bacterium]|nr:2OG-Fe(II) oxygenase [Micromonosporaceae bacterium]